MDIQKKNALLQWVSAVSNVNVDSLEEIDTCVLIKLFKSVDFDINWEEADFFTSINVLFQPATVSKDKILANDELEKGKLLCLILEFSLTCPSNDKFIEMIQLLPEEVQINIMSLTKMVSENNQEVDFDKIMQAQLQKSVVSEELVVSGATTPTAQKFDSPKVFCMASPISASPLSTFISSPKAMMKVMMENKKLKQRIRQSEAFEESVYETEKKKNSFILHENNKLLKERSTLHLRIDSLEDTINKLKDEVESLNGKIEMKNKVMAELTHNVQEKCDLVTQLQTTVDNVSEIEKEMDRMKRSVEAERLKNKELNLTLNQSEQSLIETRRCLCEEKEKTVKLNDQLNQLRQDNEDYVMQLENKINHFEKMAVSKNEAKQEKLSESLEQEKVMKDLQNTVNEMKKKLSFVESERDAFKASCVNIGNDLERQKKIYWDIKKNFEESELRLTEAQSKHDETVLASKNQASQYMNQVSVLLGQVQQHTDLNKELNARITKAEEEYRLMENQLKLCEDKSKEMQLEYEAFKNNKNRELAELKLQLQNVMQSKDALETELENETAKMKEMTSLVDQLNRKIDIINEERSEEKRVFQRNELASELERTKLKQLEETNLELNKKLQDFKEIKTSHDELKIEHLETVEVKEKKITDLLTTIDDLKKVSAEKSLLEKKVTQQDECLKENSSKNADLQIKCETLSKELENKHLLLNETCSKYENLEQSYKNVKGECETLTRKCSVLENISKESSQLKNEMCYYEEKFKEMQQENEVLKKKHQFVCIVKSQMEKTLDEKEKNEKEAEDLITKLKEENEDLCQQLSMQKENIDMQDENEQLVVYNNNLIDKISVMEKEIENLKTVNESQNAKENELKEELQKYRVEFEGVENEEKDLKEQIEYLEYEKKQQYHDFDREAARLRDTEARLKDTEDQAKEVYKKFLLEEEKRKQLATRNASLEVQLQSANTAIQKLKREVFDKGGSSKITHSTRIDDFSDLDSTFQLAEIQENKQRNAAEEIFHQSRMKNASARRSVVLSTKYEETESSEDDSLSHITRTYSLRSKGDRRRSFQPRVYMGGRTPPGRRTAGNTMDVPLSAMTMEPEVEPDLTNSWDLLSKLHEERSKDQNEEDRYSELQRRNTLCLPHLKSSYPMELAVTNKPKPVAENELRGGSSTVSKRRMDEEQRTLMDAPRGTFKKFKTENLLSWTEPATTLSRASQSDSTLRLNKISQSPDQSERKPPASSLAFEIPFEPKKVSRPPPRLARSNASGNLMKDRANVVNNESVTKNEDRRKTFVKSNSNTHSSRPASGAKKAQSSTGKENEVNSSFTRNSTKRSSFLKAKSKVTESIRNRKSTNKLLQK